MHFKFLDQEPFKKCLSKDPLFLVDVGSSGGTKFPWGEIKQFLKIVDFEPNTTGDLSETEKKDVSDNVVFTGSVALSDRRGDETLFVTKHPDNSSLLEPNILFMEQFAVSDRYIVSEKISVSVDTLDNQLNLVNINEVDFIKIDTQGSELSVLKGSQFFLDKVLGVEVEVNFSDRYNRQCYFSEVDEFLRKNGFILFDLERRYFKRKNGLSLGGPKGQMTHGNALYLKATNYFEKIIQRDDSYLNSLIKIISLSLLYGYCDYAMHILEKFKDHFEKEDYISIKMAIKKHNKDISNLLPLFPGRGVLYNTFNFIKELLRINSPRGNFGDKGLGNYRIK